MMFRQSNHKRQRGFTLVFVALFVVVFILFAALAIDMGVAYTSRTSAQHAADAAALSGAYTFVTQPLLTGDERVGEAFSRGSAVASTYKVLDTQVNITARSASSEACDTAQESMICVDEGKRRVSAVVAANVPTFFGRVLTDFLKVRVIAHAEAATNAAGDRCIKPIYISNDAISPVPLGSSKPSNNDYLAKCQAAYQNGTTIFDDAGNLTDYAKTYIENQKNFTSYIGDPSGCTNTATGACPIPILTKANSPNPSQVGIVDFNAGQGNGAVDEAMVKCSMERCLQECASAKAIYNCGDPVVGLKTGVTWGQLEPLNQFIGGGTSRYVDVGLYNNGDGPNDTTSQAVVTVLVWDCRNQLPNGTQGEVVLPSAPTIKGVGQLFINKVAKDTTNAFLVGGGPCDLGGTNASGPGAIPVRLVNK